MNKLSFFLSILLLCLSFSSNAGKIDKAFQSLKVYNYFDAKEKFEKKLEKVPSPSAYGLATIYYRQDNPFHNIDSAYRLVYVAERTFSQLKEKKAIRYAQFGFSKAAIDDLKKKIASYYYKQLDAKNSISEWTIFLQRNPNALEKKQATFTRDSLALVQARGNNTTKAFQRFQSMYPNSELTSEATSAFHLAEYREQTSRGTVSAYQGFMKKYPENPFVGQAQDEVYKLMTKKNSVQDLNTFIQSNPKNRNTEEAWRRLYQVYMYNYSDERIEQFETDFPDYPFKNELKSDLQLSKLQLFPMRVFNKFGAMNLDGNVKIPPTYESLNLFYEGLALASRDGKFGYINKANEVVIPFQFNSGYDFEEGRAIVEIKDQYGLVDRTGKVIMPIDFSDIGTFSEGLIYAEKGGKYAFYDKFGNMRIPARFSEAFSFSNGIAKVQEGNKQAFINTLGEYVIKPKYEEVKYFTENLLIFLEDDYYGLIDGKGKVVLSAIYDKISFVQDGLAMIVMDNEIGYIDSLGTVLIAPKFETFANSIIHGQFLNGTAIVKSRGKMGLIDQAGKFYVKNQYAQLGRNSEMIAYSKGKLWGFIDKAGRMKIKPTYQWAESFSNGLAIVAIEGKQGVIGKDNKEVLAIEYDEISHLDNQFYLLEKGEKYGLANKAGTIVVPLEYKEVRQLNATTFVLVLENQLEYLYLPDNKIVEQK